MDSGDWSHFAKGSEDANAMRDAISNTATEMHRLGRMTDQELTLVNTRAQEASGHFAHLSGELDRQNGIMDRSSSSGGGGGKFRKLLGDMGGAARGLREHLQSLGGFNVFGDMLQGGLDFIHNMDRIGVELGKNTLKFTTMGAVGGAALGSLATIAADLGTVIGGTAIVLPAFAIGAGISIGVLSAALKDMKTVLKDLKPQFKALQDSISKSFWEQAAGPIRDTVNALMPILAPKLNANARALGGLVGKLAKAFRDIPASSINTMFDRMNRAVDILGNAMSPIIQAFTTLGLTGSKYFERFTSWMVKLSNQFNNFVQRSAKNGDLDRWIERAIEGFKNIWRAVGGAVGIFDAIAKAAEKAGFGGLKTLADALQGISDIMNSDRFQKSLVDMLGAARGLTLKLVGAIKDVGPAFESFVPTAVTAIDHVGTAVSDLIGYVGDIFSNPTFQQGVRDFTGSLENAVKKLEPAIKPFADSLGTTLTLLGNIVEAVAEIATAFTVQLSPVLDTMSDKISTLVDPLKDTAINLIKTLKGPLQELDKQFVGPLVDAFKTKLLPAINDFIKEFGPFATKVIEDLGPSFKILVSEVLPNLVRLATELLDPLGGIVSLLSPTLALTLEKIGKAFSNLADAIKILKGELPITELFIFKAMDPENIRAQADNARREIAYNMDPKNAGNVEWSQIVSDIFWGQKPDVFWSRVWNKIGPDQAGIDNYNRTMGKNMEDMRQKVVKDWDDLWSGKVDRDFADKMIGWFPGQADFINGVTGWIDDVFTGKWFVEAKDNIVTMWNDTWKEGGNADQLDKTVNDWLKANVVDPFSGAMDNLGKQIPESFKSDVKEWGLGPAIVNWFNNDIAPEIGKGFTEGWKNISEGRWGSSPEGAKKWEGFWKGWNDFWSAPEGSFTADINKTVNKWFTDNVFTPLGDAWDGAWKSVGDWFNSGGDGGGSGRGDNNGQDVWNKFWGGFEGMFKDTKSANADISKTVNDWLDTNVWKPIGDWFKNLDWEQIGEDLWNGFIAGVTGKSPKDWEKITEGFKGWVEDMKNFFGIHSPSTLMYDMAVDIVTGFINGFGGLGELVGQKWEEIKTWIGTKIEEIKTNLNVWIEERKNDWNAFWGAFGTTVATKWEEFKTTIATKIEDIKTKLNTWIEDRKRDWTNFWTSIGTTLRTKWDEFKLAISTKIEEIKTNIRNFGTSVQTNWNNFWIMVGTFLRNKWQEFKNFIGTKVEEIKANIAKFGEDVKTNWNNFWGGVGTTLRNKWTEFKTTVSTKGQEVIDWFKGLPQKLVDAMGNLWDKFLAVGGDIWGGLKKGIEGGWDWVTKSATDLANGAVEAAQKALDSNSPSKKFIHLGEGTGEGLVVGMAAMAGAVAAAGELMVQNLQSGVESQMDPLLNTLQAVTDAVTDTVTADLSKSKMYVAGADAAQGLADGLKANRSSVHNALGSLGAFTMPSSVTVGGVFAASAVCRPTADATPGRSVTIAEGAIKIETPTKSPDIVAAKVIDSFVNYSSL
jgi:hypothetical protein